ncbi:LLM class oxidoreductase [Halioglobus maricola]|uniref:LLM class oxidoreductase n=1 Tax=Halioglobus maricola TaxID=2601894 RepID=A0A5P9NIQ2_9GAMM|nr:LLM class oxidoreductase [Halioglobus maricola]QFU75439.1 LLM class oxidoreductase [Halioglobus maricola]
MNTVATDPGFAPINRAYGEVFQQHKLSVGLVVPLERYASNPVPRMARDVERIRLAEELGFASVWLRDVPFNVPSFGDAGQVYDPFVYLGLLAGQTDRIALGMSSIVLPLRHPAHVAKASASVDVLSGGRLILGIASGDRPEEYPALNLDFENRGERFRESVAYIQKSWQPRAQFENSYGSPSGDMDLLPKPDNGRIPLLITGSSQQTPDWIAANGDGWMLYPRSVQQQEQVIERYQRSVFDAGRPAQPVMQPLYVDLAESADAPPRAIHLGFNAGVNYLREYLSSLEAVGVNHVALNLRFNQNNIETTLKILADELLPHFTGAKN